MQQATIQKRLENEYKNIALGMETIGHPISSAQTFTTIIYSFTLRKDLFKSASNAESARDDVYAKKVLVFPQVNKRKKKIFHV